MQNDIELTSFTENDDGQSHTPPLGEESAPARVKIEIGSEESDEEAMNEVAGGSDQPSLFWNRRLEFPLTDLRSSPRAIRDIRKFISGVDGCLLGLDEDCLELGQVIRQALQRLSVVDAGGAVLALLMNQDMRQDLRGVQPDLGQGFALLTATSPAVRRSEEHTSELQSQFHL